MPTFSPTQFSQLYRENPEGAAALLNDPTMRIIWSDESDAMMEYYCTTLLDYMLMESQEGAKNLGINDNCSETFTLNTTW